jgi:hypothetical protein
MQAALIEGESFDAISEFFRIKCHKEIFLSVWNLFILLIFHRNFMKELFTKIKRRAKMRALKGYA